MGAKSEKHGHDGQDYRCIMGHPISSLIEFC